MRPSIQWVNVQTGEPDALPRMDVAGFVGLASAGPLHIPVAIESEQQFRDLFGDDQVLAWDEETDEPIFSYLGPTVRSFFQGGGRRCWVVRVATTSATSNRFALPGVVAPWSMPTGRPPRFGAARLRARSPGSWADDLKVCPTLQADALLQVAVHARDHLVAFRSALTPQTALAPGNLVRLRCDQGRYIAFVAVQHAQLDPGATRQWAAGEGWWFSTDHPLPPGPVSVQRLDTRRSKTVAYPAHWLPSDPVAGATLLVAAPTGFDPGAVVTVADSSGDTCLVTVAGCRPAFGQEAAAYPGLPNRTWVLSAASVLWPLDAAPALDQAQHALGERLSLDLRVESGSGGASLLRGLGFCAGHPRFLGDLPTDSRLWRPAAGAASRPDSPLWADAKDPRFPLAAEHRRWGTYLPIGLGELPPRGYPAERATKPRLERDGLFKLGPETYVDQRLAQLSMAELTDEVYQTLRPRGVHALWGLEEVTMVAVPDLGHLPWDAPADPVSGPETPETAQTAEMAQTSHDSPHATFGLRGDRISLELGGGDGLYMCTWQVPGRSGGHETYRLAKSYTPDFAATEVIYQGSGDRVLVSAEGPVFYLRVQAQESGIWSNPVRVAGASAPGDLPQQQKLADLTAYLEKIAQVHAAVLRLAAVRGDMLAILSVPDVCFKEDVVMHRHRLVRALVPADEDALAYGALYHPWVQVEGVHGNPLRTPPDGTVVGQFAWRALTQGAWVSAANLPMQNVLALDGTFSERDVDLLVRAGVNPLRMDHRGSFVLHANTLSLVPGHKPLGERRLIMLLRRLLLREGQRLVFRPFDDQFPAMVQQQLELLLTALYVRGALVGNTPADAFRVTPVEINRKEARLVMDIAFAPSKPLQFITFRLIQAQGILPVVQEG